MNNNVSAEDLQYVQSTEAWMKTQQLSIDSCDLNIEFFNRQIDLLNRSIDAESAEKTEKIRLLEIMQGKLTEFKIERGIS